MSYNSDRSESDPLSEVHSNDSNFEPSGIADALRRR